jgi:PKD domain
MKKLNSLFVLTILMVLLLSACRKAQEIKYNDDEEANFTYTIVGDTAFFTNSSVGINSYSWNFGDGTTSTEDNPTHVFPGKGEYLISLSSGDIKANTMLSIDKSSPVKVNDGTFDDWINVTTNVINSGATAGVAIQGKFDYDANYIYFYIEQATTLADETIITVFFNTDQDNETGFYPGSFTDLGVDNYFEGQLLLLEGERWLDEYSFTGGDDHEGWNWEPADFGEFWMMGTNIEDAGTVKHEFAIDRNKFPGLKNDFVTIGISILDSEWSDIGYLPDGETPGFELNLNE